MQRRAAFERSKRAASRETPESEEALRRSFSLVQGRGGRPRTKARTDMADSVCLMFSDVIEDLSNNEGRVSMLSHLRHQRARARRAPASPSQSGAGRSHRDLVDLTRCSHLPRRRWRIQAEERKRGRRDFYAALGASSEARRSKSKPKQDHHRQQRLPRYEDKVLRQRERPCDRAGQPPRLDDGL